MNPFDNDDPTRVDFDPDLDDMDTPRSIPRCTDCGQVAFIDNFTSPGSIVATGIFSEDRCVRAPDNHWRWCAQRRMLVYFVPR